MPNPSTPADHIEENSPARRGWVSVPNAITLRQRLVELLIDYLVIVGYLAALGAVALAVYFLVLGRLPAASPLQTHVVSFFTSVVPVVVGFSLFDYRAGGTPGKRVAKLSVRFKSRDSWRSLVRNAVKFLPWQLAHLGVVAGITGEFGPVPIALTTASMLVAGALVAMMLLRKDRRHLGDLLAGTQVVPASGEASDAGRFQERAAGG